MKTATQLYDHLVSVIDKAAVERSIYHVPSVAEQEGMEAGETERGLNPRWFYSFQDSVGAKVTLECRWYDQSKAFSIQPDMHIMTVTLEACDDRRSHERRYEE